MRPNDIIDDSPDGFQGSLDGREEVLSGRRLVRIGGDDLYRPICAGFAGPIAADW